MARRRKTQERARQLQEQAAADPFHNVEGNAIERWLHRAAYFIRTHRREVLYGLGGALVLSLIVIALLVWQDIRVERSRLAFDRIRQDVTTTGGFGTASAALEQLEQYRDDYSDSGAQIRAALYSLPHLIDSGDLSGAARECEFLAGELDTPELRAYFLIKAGYLYEEVEETESARRAFNRSYSLLNSDHPARAHARFGEGRALIRLGQREEGRAAIHDVLEMRDVEGLERIQQQAVAYLLRENR
ncbi:MAG: hypothetical protein H7A21_15055 [Spirochaetales bacterium]|nr:hypothetical protein [Leptospiraceae bacterium]MCP5482752.1 hypothetical protein [Spirochaetales bacterium]MCP5485246.1 hypothetical protein [Spirochaetales bacterium]